MIDNGPAQGGVAGSMRLRLDLAYDGTDFSGWAKQPGRRTVQDTVEVALARVLRLADQPALTVAGRTDAGVHTQGQVAHVDLDPACCEDPELLSRRLRRALPEDVTLWRISIAAEGFDARFSAIERRYRYRLADGPVDPLRRRDTVANRRSLDPEAMNTAAQALVGEHDFAAYAKPREGASTVRTLHRLEVIRDADGVLLVHADADAFCHNQVRSMVGALVAVGERRRDVTWPGEVLAARVRDSGVTVAAARGLTLLEVRYPPDDQLAAQSARARRLRA